MRIRFSIRDLLWLMLVAALATGWWTDRTSRFHSIRLNEKYEQKYEQKITKLDATIKDLKVDNAKLLRAFEKAYFHNQENPY